MQQPGGVAKRSGARVSLHIGSSFADSWEGVIRPWFESLALTASDEAGLNVVVLPFRSTAYMIKRLLLNSGISFLGIRFMSPSDLRELLASKSNTCVPPREHLRLLLSISAEQCMELPDDPASREKRLADPEYLAAKSVVRTPNHLLRTIDRLGAAGWDLDAVELPSLREITSRFQTQLENCGFELNHQIDARILAESNPQPRVFGNILVAGLNGAHWPLWTLVRAAVTSAADATVILENPDEQARQIDEAWIGTWENVFGPATPISTAANRPNDSLFTEEEMRGSVNGYAKRAFLVGANATEQAEAIAQQCVHFLGEPTCERVGIIFSRAGSLSRLVGDVLVRRGIPHYDGLAHLVPGFFEAADWRAWLQLQESPRVDALLRFMNVLPVGHALLCGLQPDKFERTLRSVHGDVLIDDLDVLQQACAQAASESAKSVARALESIRFLPSRGALANFLRETQAALDQLGWNKPWTELSRYLGPWTKQANIEFSRSLYLRWLREIASSFSIFREPLGDHPYAPVQLLTVAQASGQDWSHIIFAEANEGSWPPPGTGEFLRENQIEEFNLTIRQLNRRVTQQGRQGEGHTAVRDPHTFYLGPTEQRQIACRQFDRLLESTGQKITCAASLVQEDAPERFWNPSELLTRQYLEARSRPLTQRTMIRLQSETKRWLAEAGDGKKRNVSVPVEKEPVRIAYDARRDANASSGRYDFAFRSAPPVIPTLSVSDFEQLMAAPALVWLRKYVGVQAAEDDSNVWNTSSGKWVHDWLAAMASGTTKTFTSLPDPIEIQRKICAAAEAKRTYIERLCKAAGRALPDWWTGGWRNAVYLARILAEKLSDVSGWPWAATEWVIEDDAPIQVIPNVMLRFRGRIDLILARSELATGSLATDELWIIDYKTGAKKALSSARQGPDGRRAALKKKLLDGSALQLGLYALAANQSGARQVEVSLVSPLVRPLHPQMSGGDFTSEVEIFAELARMQQTGIFGMHGPLRSAFRFTEDYPLATIAIDPDVLEQRWELTHPALVRDEEEIFW